MPIFRFNTVNPNVLKIKIDINTLYQTELQAGFLKELDKRAVRHLAGPYSESTRLNPFLSEAAIIQYVGNKLQASQGTQEARNDVARELAENFVKSEFEKLLIDPKFQRLEFVALEVLLF